MAAIDEEIGIQREHFSVRVKFREPYQAGIGQRHRPVTIAIHERPQVLLLSLNIERNPDHAPLQQGEQRVCIMTFPFQEKGRFR